MSDMEKKVFQRGKKYIRYSIPVVLGRKGAGGEGLRKGRKR